MRVDDERIEDLRTKLTAVKQAYFASGQRGSDKENEERRLTYIQALERLAYSVNALLKELTS